MYTRGFDGRSDGATLPQINEAESLAEKNGVTASDVSENEQVCEKRTEERKARYRATRIPRLYPREECGKPETEQVRAQKGILSDLGSDGLLIGALIILLMCEGRDDILILALCFILV